MFSKKIKLRNLIDKHQNTLLSITSDKTPPPSIQSETNIKHEVCLDVHEEAFVCLIYGFVRPIVALMPYAMHNHVLDDIVEICLTFYNRGFEELKFDLFNPTFCSVLYHEILKGSLGGNTTSCHRVFSTSIGWHNGVHKWKMKYIAADKKSISAPYGGIGIVSHNKILSKENKFSNYYQENYKTLNWINHRSFGNVIYFDQTSKCVYQYTNGRGKVLFSAKHMKRSTVSYQHGDVITIVLDCNRWKLKILRNQQNIFKEDQEIDIEKQQIVYYPVVAFYHHGDTYRVLRK